jgi:hypothetical protein
MRRFRETLGRQVPLHIALIALVICGARTTSLWAAAGDVVADRVLGQPDGAHAACNTIDPEAINQPNAVAIDKSVSPNRLYVTDTGNNRVLGYSSISALLNGYPSSLVRLISFRAAVTAAPPQHH